MKTTHYSVKIPKVGNVVALSIEALGDAAWTAVHGGNAKGQMYGASEVGACWPVFEINTLRDVTVRKIQIGTMRYNGRFDGTPGVA